MGYLVCSICSVWQGEMVVKGNSKLGASESIAEIGGPAVAGPLVQLVSAPIAIFFDAVSFLFSAFCVGLIPTISSVSWGQHQFLLVCL